MARKLKVPEHLIPKTTERGPPAAIAAAIEGGRVPKVSSDKLDELKELVIKARAVEQRIERGNALLTELKVEDSKLVMEIIPDFMDRLGIPSITVEGKGNEPAFVATNSPFYAASLSKPKKPDQPDRRPEGFAYLEKIGHGDLIKQEVSFLFPAKTDPALIHEFVRRVGALKIEVVQKRTKKKLKLEVPFPTVAKSVHSNTLTAWLRRQVEQEEFVPDLTKINGFIGKKVSIETVDD